MKVIVRNIFGLSLAMAFCASTQTSETIETTPTMGQRFSGAMRRLFSSEGGKIARPSYDPFIEGIEPGITPREEDYSWAYRNASQTPATEKGIGREEISSAYEKAAQQERDYAYQEREKARHAKRLKDESARVLARKKDIESDYKKRREWDEMGRKGHENFQDYWLKSAQKNALDNERRIAAEHEKDVQRFDKEKKEYERSHAAQLKREQDRALTTQKTLEERRQQKIQAHPNIASIYDKEYQERMRGAQEHASNKIADLESTYQDRMKNLAKRQRDSEQKYTKRMQKAQKDVLAKQADIEKDTQRRQTGREERERAYKKGHMTQLEDLQEETLARRKEHRKYLGTLLQKFKAPEEQRKAERLKAYGTLQEKPWWKIW